MHHIIWYIFFFYLNLTLCYNHIFYIFNCITFFIPLGIYFILLIILCIYLIRFLFYIYIRAYLILLLKEVFFSITLIWKTLLWEFEKVIRVFYNTSHKYINIYIVKKTQKIIFIKGKSKRKKGVRERQRVKGKWQITWKNILGIYEKNLSVFLKKHLSSVFFFLKKKRNFK